MKSIPEDVPARFTPEFRLVLTCIHWPLDETATASIAQASESVRDWNRVLAIAQRHRVIGLVARALMQAEVELPPATAKSLHHHARLQAQQAMLLATESVRLARRFQTNGIEPLFLKGATITLLAYGDLGLRHAKDVDMLVPESQVWQAADILRAAGYAPMLNIDGMSPQRLQIWLRHAKSMDWIHPTSKAQIELHWRLTDLHLSADAMSSDTRQSVAIMPGMDLTTLGQDQLVAYLCAHGAAHGWSRLKWLADVAALLPWHNPAAIDLLYRNAAVSGAHRAVGQALLLCHDLLHLPLDNKLLSELHADKMLGLLHRWALRLLARGDEVAEIYDQPFGTSSVYLSRFLLGDNSRSLLGEMRTWAYPPDNMLVSQLPESLFFLFPIVRVGSWVAQRMRHGGRSAP